MIALTLSPRAIARALGGELSGGSILVPGPGHSHRDRSLKIFLDAAAPNGFRVHSFAGDDPLACRDHVRERLGLERDDTPLVRESRRGSLGTERPNAGRERRQRASWPVKANDAARTASALPTWHEAVDPRGTPAGVYLTRRGVRLPEAAGDVLRFHPDCAFDAWRTPALVALVRDIITNEPRAIHRTAIDLSGTKRHPGGGDPKQAKRTLGPIGGGAVKLTPDDDVTLCLGVGEGIETVLSLRELPAFGPSPVWSLISEGGVRLFPVLPGIDVLWIAVDRDANGKGQEAARICADRWAAAGREVRLVRPRLAEGDLNDVLKEDGHEAD